MNETTIPPMIRAELPTGPLRTEKAGALMVAKAKAQGAFDEVRKSTPGQDGNRRFLYADLGEIRRATQPALSANGLAWESFFATEPIDEGRSVRVYVWTELHHGESEQSQRTPFAIFTVAAEAMKQIGGASSYLRRYQVQALLGIAAEDDNAEEAGDRAAPPPPAARAAAPARPAAAAPPADRTLEPGEDPPAMKQSHVELARAAIATKDWKAAVAAIGKIPAGKERTQVSAEYEAARFPKQTPATA